MLRRFPFFINSVAVTSSTLSGVVTHQHQQQTYNIRFQSSNSTHHSMSSLREKIKQERLRLRKLEKSDESNTSDANQKKFIKFQTDEEALEAEIDNFNAEEDSIDQTSSSSSSSSSTRLSSVSSSPSKTPVIENENDSIDESEDEDEEHPSFEDVHKAYSDRKAVIEELREQRAERQNRRAQWLVWQASQREKGFEQRVRKQIEKQVGRRRDRGHHIASRTVSVGNKLVDQHEYDDEVFEEQNNTDDVTSPSSSSASSSNKQFSGRNRHLFENVDEVKPNDFHDENNNQQKEEDIFADSDDFYYGSSEKTMKNDVAMRSAGMKHMQNQPSVYRRGRGLSVDGARQSNADLYGMYAPP